MKKISKIIKGVPSSFVFKNMKLDTDKGAGEAKLFVGPKSQIEDINDFFKFDQAYSYRFDKSNLLNYLHEVKMEYVFQPESEREAIDYLAQVRDRIAHFEFRPGTMDDAFIALTGREVR